ncbi:MAG: Hsp33 family molecular chaperone HslO [Desulfobacterales bacterium]
MKKKKIFGRTLKEQYIAGANDRLTRFIMCDDSVRGAVVNTTKMINEMRSNHELGILETMVLGHAYIAGALIASGLKGNDRICLQIECSGPIKGLTVEANAFGEVRGYLKNIPIPVDKPLEDFNLSPFFGAGFISLIKYLEGSKQPFKGQVELQYGSIAKDLTYYFSKSEQIPTAVNLSIKFDSEGNVSGAGGLLLQVMPVADDEAVGSLEEIVLELPSIGEYFAEKNKAETLILESFKTCSPKLLANHRVEFMCHCGKERMKDYLLLLPPDDFDDLCRTGPFPLELRCHHCNSSYMFSEIDLQKLKKNRTPADR